MLENKLLGPMINTQTGKEFNLAEFFNDMISEINNEMIGGFDIDCSEDNPMVHIRIDQSNGDVRTIQLVSKNDYPRYLELMGLDNNLRNELEHLGFVRSWLNEPQDNEASKDSYHLELVSPVTESRYMLSVFDTLFPKHGSNQNRELNVTFEVLDKEGDHDEVIFCHIESDEFLKHIK